MNSSLFPINEIATPSAPITTFIVKIASRCNLACTYCYMYEHADQSWREQPRFISDQNIALFAERLQAYVRERNIARLQVVVHGGEPLLIGPSKLEFFFSTIINALEPLNAQCQLCIQTNGTLITQQIVNIFKRYNVQIGVSLDGPKIWNDLYRVDKNGRGTFDKVIQKLNYLKESYREIKDSFGLLMVANPKINPRDLLVFLQTINVTSVDFLFPDFNHDTYPYDLYAKGAIGQWYIDLFELWMAEEFQTSNIRIRIFDVLLRLVLGSKNGFDAFGSESQAILVIETDGFYHALDVLKTSYHGATKTGFSLTSTPIKVIEDLLVVQGLARKELIAPAKCLSCTHWNVCGGGYLPHRYSSKSGFHRESVYCEDLTLLIQHVKYRVQHELLDTLSK